MYFATINAVACLFALAFTIFLFVRGVPEPSRRQILIYAVGGVLLISCETWILGPWSFAAQEIDLDFGVSTFLFDLQRPPGLFSHQFAGGQDVAAMSLNTGQYLSLERILLSLLPLWLAHAAHSLLSSAVAVAGGYLAARRMFAAPRLTSLALAFLFSLSHMHVATYLWPNGLGYPLMPLAAYLCVGRQGQRWYWGGVVALAFVHAISSTPNQSFVALAPVVVAASVLMGPHTWLRTVGALAVLVLALVANWHESLYAKVLIAPLSYRGSMIRLASPLGQAAWTLVATRAEVILLMGLACVASFTADRCKALMLVAMSLLAVFAGPMLLNVPWDRLGLTFMRGFNFLYIGDSAAGVALLVGAAAATSVALPRGWPLRCLTVAIVGLACFNFVWQKAHHVTSWISQGGVSIMSAGLEALRERPRPATDDQRVRSIVLPHRLPLNLQPAAGLDALDGAFNLYLTDFALYWQKALFAPLSARTGHEVDVSSATLNLEKNDIDLKCCDRYRLADWADLTFLRIANVGEVFSLVPLADEALLQVSGPDPASVPVRNTGPVTPRLLAYARQIANPPPVRTYRLTDPLPRVFVASRVVEMPAASSISAFLEEVRMHAPGRAAVVRAGDGSDLLSVADDAPEITALRLGCDSATVLLKSGSAGVVVFNIGYSPFWRASADDRSAPVVSANQVHMAVPAPAGTHRVVLRYERPMLRQKLASRLGADPDRWGTCPVEGSTGGP